MKRRISLLVAFSLMIGSLTACGGEYLKETGNVSGAAVSGQAVSVTEGAVSGQAIEEVPKPTPTVQKIVTQKRKKERTNWFFSTTNFYYVETASAGDSKKIIEENLSDGTKRVIMCDGLSNLCYVNNKWVYYTVCADEYSDKEYFYRAPIKKNQLNLNKAELLFTEKDGFWENEIYCDGRYVVYTTFYDSRYKKYDLKKKKWIGDFYKYEKYADSKVLAVAGNYIYVCLGDTGLYQQKLDSAPVEKITGDDEIWGPGFVATETAAFYCVDDSGECYVIKYHAENKKKQEIITKLQIEKILQENKIIKEDDYYWYEADGMFVSGKRLYLQLNVGWDDKDGKRYQKEIIVYVELADESTLYYAKELTECVTSEKALENSFGNLPFGANLSRGFCVEMTDEKCYMLLYNDEEKKNMPASYQFASGKLKYLTSQDLDWYLPYYVANLASMEELLEGWYIDEKEYYWPFEEFYSTEGV